MTIGTFGEDLLIDNDGIAVDENRFFVTHVTSNFGVPTLKRKMRARVVIKNRWDPALRIMTIGTGGLPGLCKLPCMSIFVTTLTILRGAFELNFFGAHGRLVAGPALDHTMCAEQRELCLRVIEPVDFRPGPRVVAGLAS